jgi:hypothetical protein
MGLQALVARADMSLKALVFVAKSVTLRDMQVSFRATIC